MVTPPPVHTTLPVTADLVTTVHFVLDPPPHTADSVTTVASILNLPPASTPDASLKKCKANNYATVKKTEPNRRSASKI